MTSSLTHRTFISEERRKYVMTHIDDLNLLLYYKNQFKPLKNIEGTISYYRFDQEHEKRVFKELFSRAPVGDIKVFYSENPHQLRFEDTRESRLVRIKLHENSESESIRDSNLFLSMRSYEEAPEEDIPIPGATAGSFSYNSVSFSYLIELQSSDSRVFKGMLSVNGDSLHGKVHITFWGKDGVGNLFSTVVQSVQP